MHSVLKVIVLIPFCIEFTNVMMLSKQGSLPASFPYRLTKGEGKTELSHPGLSCQVTYQLVFFCCFFCFVKIHVLAKCLT